MKKKSLYKKIISIIISVVMIIPFFNISSNAVNKKNIGKSEDIFYPKVYNFDKYNRKLDSSQIKYTYFIGHDNGLDLKNIFDESILSKIQSIDTLTKNMSIVTFKNINDIDIIIEKIKKIDCIDFIEKDQKVKKYKSEIQTKEIDTANIYKVNPEQWYIKDTGVEDVWKEINSSADTAIVSVIDTGVELDHPALKDSVLPYGKDFFGYSDEVVDSQGHGTNIAGMIAGCWDKNAGSNALNGICSPYGVKILPMKIWGREDYTYMSSIVKSICYSADVGADVINMSYGSEEPSLAEQRACEYASNLGVILVASSGNEYNKTTNYPAAYDCVLSIGSSNKQNQRSDFSSYDENIFMLAPGEDIYTTQIDNKYTYVNGTSFSAPYICALIAIMKTQIPYISLDEVKKMLIANAMDIESPGYDIKTGYGIINGNTFIRDVASKGAIINIIRNDDNNTCSAEIYLDDNYFNSLKDDFVINIHSAKIHNITNLRKNKINKSIAFDFKLIKDGSQNVDNLYFIIDSSNFADTSLRSVVAMSNVIIEKNKPVHKTPENLYVSFETSAYGNIIGSTTDMEYSLDGGYSYRNVYENDMYFTVDDFMKINSKCGVMVRYKRTAKINASLPVKLEVIDQTKIPIVNLDNDGGVIDFEGYEYSYNGEYYYKANGEMQYLQYGEILHIRYPAKGNMKPSFDCVGTLNENGLFQMLVPESSALYMEPMSAKKLQVYYIGDSDISVSSSNPAVAEVVDGNLECYQGGISILTFTSNSGTLITQMVVYCIDEENSFRDNLVCIQKNDLVESMAIGSKNKDNIYLNEKSSDPNIANSIGGYIYGNSSGICRIDTEDMNGFKKQHYYVAVSEYPWLNIYNGFNCFSAQITDVNKFIENNCYINLPYGNGYSMELVLSDMQLNKIFESGIKNLKLNYGEFTYIFDTSKFNLENSDGFISIKLSQKGNINSKNSKADCKIDIYTGNNFINLPLISDVYNGEIVVEYKSSNKLEFSKVKITELGTDKKYVIENDTYKFAVKSKRFIILAETACEFDDISKHWCYNYVNTLANRNLLFGVGNGKYMPEEKVTRAQFAAMLVRAFGLKEKENLMEFTDVNKENWFYNEVKIAASNGLLIGYDNKFRPDDEITREDMCVIMYRMICNITNTKLPRYDYIVSPVFTDRAYMSNYSIKAIEYSYILGTIKGTTNDVSYNVFDPKGKATRGACAVIIYNLIRYL